MLDYTFIDTIVVRFNLISEEDSEIIKDFKSALDNYGLPVEISKIPKCRFKNTISYRIRTTFAKYKPKKYDGNDSTNIHPAPLNVYNVFFTWLLYMSNYVQEKHYAEEYMLAIEQIDITKQTLMDNTSEEWLKSLMKLKLTGKYKSIQQNSCYYVYHPKQSYNRISNYKEVFKIYEKSCEIINTKAIKSPLILKYVPSKYSINKFMDLYNSTNNSLNIEDLKMLRAEISLKGKQVEKLINFLDTTKFSSVSFLYNSIINRTFYNILNNFFSDYIKNRFDLPELIRQNNKPLKVFQSCYLKIENPILKSYIMQKSLDSKLTKEIVLNNTGCANNILDKLMNNYEPPI